MDLSQQELPLTAHFSRGSKDTGARGFRKKDKHATEDSQSVARSSKRKRNDVSTTPLSSSMGLSELRPKTLQLPTPAASARKRVRDGHFEDLPGKSQLTSSSASVEHQAVLKDLAQLEFEPAPLEPPQSSREGAGDATFELPCTSLATPSTDRRRTTKSITIETGIATPRVTSQRVPEPRHRTDRSPLAQHSDRPLHSKPKNGVFAPRDAASVLLSKTADGQPFDDHVIPMLPIPSSQSQYLLHIDATPERKQRSQRIEHIITSQTQEEREFTLSSFLQPAAVVSLSSVPSPGK